MEKKKKKNCAFSFHGINVTCYIKFELLYKLRIITVRTQTPLDGPGLEWAHNLLILVGLVFPTKGCFWPSDLVAPLVPHEFYLFSS